MGVSSIVHESHGSGLYADERLTRERTRVTFKTMLEKVSLFM